MVAPKGNNPSGIDLSIMPTLECNLECSFCMYRCGEETTDVIDFEKLENFLKTVPKEIINIFGLYGGEPSINIPLYEKVIELLPRDVPKFTITNGTWTKFLWLTQDFIEYTIRHNIECYISSTPEHTLFQSTTVLKNILESYNNFSIKEDDTQKRMLPMGRNAEPPYKHLVEPYCTIKCIRLNGPERLAIMPSGHIIYQTCDGSYPVVGTIDEPWNPLEYSKKVQNCQVLERL